MVQHKGFNEEGFLHVLDQLERDVILPPRYRDHELSGCLTGIRECHIKDDLLLLYRTDKNLLILLLLNIGTHTTLFG